MVKLYKLGIFRVVKDSEVFKWKSKGFEIVEDKEEVEALVEKPTPKPAPKQKRKTNK